MRKGFVLVALLLWSVPAIFPAIVTNTNQSVLFFRFPSRNASTDLDAVYYNPAGLVKLQDGFHIALHNQTIFQDKTVTNTFLFLNDPEYLGETRVPVFPNVYAVYKKSGLALSLGFGPIAGGGSADYAEGLPSFEVPISMIPALLSAAGLPTTQYSAKISFNGSSVYYGFQANIAYALSDILSAAVGLRYVYAVNKYEGSIKDILVNARHPLLNPAGNMIPASTFLGAQAADMEVDAKQVGSGITPIVGLHIAPTENFKVGARYEFNTKLELENQTTKDDVGMFPAGTKERSDIPANLSIGADYALAPQFRASVSYSLFFEKQAQWEDDRQDTLDGNSYDLAFALEYDVSQALTLSAGYIYTKTGAGEKYQSDLSFDLGADTVGLGARLRLSPKVDIDIGGIYVMYKDQSKSVSAPPLPAYTETYKQSTYAFGIGFNFHL